MVSKCVHVQANKLQSPTVLRRQRSSATSRIIISWNQKVCSEVCWWIFRLFSAQTTSKSNTLPVEETRTFQNRHRQTVLLKTYTTVLCPRTDLLLKVKSGSVLELLDWSNRNEVITCAWFRSVWHWRTLLRCRFRVTFSAQTSLWTTWKFNITCK